MASIAGQSINSLIASQGIGNRYRLYFATKRDGLSYHLAHILAHILEDFTEEAKEPFDTEYMGKLFDAGYKLAKAGYPWLKYPPGAEVQ